MKLKLLCCEVFMRLACIAIADSPHTIDPEFTRLGAHESPNTLRELLQSKIDSVGKKSGYEAVILGYGLCGNSTDGLRAGSVPLIIPRAHDCCTIFLGSRENFLANFGNDLSLEWGAQGYMERGTSYIHDTGTGKLLGWDKEYEDLVEKYGEENAQFIWESLHPASHSTELVYIRVPETESLGYLDKMQTHALEEGKSLRILEGNMRLIKALIHGDWNEEEFLIVPPGSSIKAVYDHEKIITVDA